jgi:hypothetical protein
MFARIESFRARPDEMDELLSAQHRAVGVVRTLPGNMGGYVLVNREVGRLLSVTFWGSIEDRRAADSEFAAAAVRGEVDEYDIAMQESLG